MIFFAALALGDFFAVNADVDGGFDADADLRSVDRHDRNFDVVTNS